MVSGCEADSETPWGRAGHPWDRQARSSTPHPALTGPSLRRVPAGTRKLSKVAARTRLGGGGLPRHGRPRLGHPVRSPTGSEPAWEPPSPTCQPHFPASCRPEITGLSRSPQSHGGCRQAQATGGRGRRGQALTAGTAVAGSRAEDPAEGGARDKDPEITQEIATPMPCYTQAPSPSPAAVLAMAVSGRC